MDVKVNHRPTSKNLEDFIKVKPYGSFISYKELNEVAGIDITLPKFRYVLEAARRVLIKHHDRVLVNVRNEGYQVADLQQTLSASAGYRKRSYKAAGRAFQLTKTVDLTNLTEKEKADVLKEQEKSACLLVCYKASENKLLNGPTERIQIEAPSESDIVRLLLDKSKSN